MAASSQPSAAGTVEVIPEGFRAMVSEAVADVSEFVASPSFQQALAEMAPMSPGRRDHFVRTVLLNPDELSRRGLTPPDGMVIQRSEFGDKRPTCFCVSKFLPEESKAWRRVTMTFDNGITHRHGAG